MGRFSGRQKGVDVMIRHDYRQRLGRLLSYCFRNAA